jgi:erythronate-4-phosphate dehydrogenase
MIIAIDKVLPYWSEAFSGLGDLQPYSASNLDPKDINHVDALVVRTVTPVNQSLLKESSVRFIAAASAGIDHVDQDYLKSRGIGFGYAAGCNAVAVSEYIITALHVAASRRNWNLSKKSIAVIGAGNVGSRVAKKTRDLGMKTLLCDPPLRDQTGDKQYRDFKDVLEADILTFHVPLTSTGPYPTWHMVDQQLLDGMSPNQFIINSSRGAVIDNGALRSALSRGRIAGAILDVWEGEPRIDRSLLDLVDIGTPHIAGTAVDGKIRAVEMAHEELRRFFHINSRWDATPCYPETRTLRLSEEADGQKVFLQPLLKAFNIIQCDSSLRQAQSAADFSQLRNEFPLRPEFRHFKILSADNGRYVDLWKNLGFEIG